MQKIIRILGTTKARNVLIALHVLLISVTFLLDHPVSPDHATYVGLAEGLEHGIYSVWWDILDPAPIDVHRTHGYPVFLVLVRGFSSNVHAIFFVQALLHLTSLFVVLRLLGKGSVLRQNIFLVLMLPQLQLIHYVYQVFPETLMVTLCTLMLLIGVRMSVGVGRTVLLATVTAACFWVRPVMLLFPLFVLIVDAFLVHRVERWSFVKSNFGVLMLFLLLGPLPFGLWNFNVNGYFKPAPLTGSALISNMGFWQLRLPGYGTMHYFQYSYFGREMVQVYSAEEAERYYDQYQEQWDRIYAESAHAITKQDSANFPIMDEHKYELYVTRSPEYTVALDDALSKENRALVLDEPGYYLASRIYAAARLWITNLNMPMDHVIYKKEPGAVPVVGSPQGVKGWVAVILPFAITFITFGIGLVWLIIDVVRHKERWYEWRYALYAIGYVWVVHVPMSIQSRYTVPVHMAAIACLAVLIAAKLQRRQQVASGTKK